mmetsp:Transcript_27878/g.82008  ORF Transcript_27878/g.82008 Transcript_27878/m.82008 type:complete len:467 (-) Transcript_27878:734-2134(-)
MRDVMSPPAVSMPSESGATSSSSRSFVSSDALPERTPPCTAAPYATDSSGLMPLFGSLPLKYSVSSCCTFGMRVEPPTRTTSSISALLFLASLRTCVTGAMVFLNKSRQSSSNRAREIVSRRSTPSLSASSSTVADVAVDSVRLAFSHARRSRCIARGSAEMSSLLLRSKTLQKCAIMRWSKSSPPRCVSPAVALTSKTPSSMESIVTSKVPPPRSYTRMFCSPFPPLALSRPYAIAAAVGSLMMRRTSSPAMVPASLVAWRWASLKWAGTVMTARLTACPRNASASALSCSSTMALICSGANERFSPQTSTAIIGLPDGPSSTRHERCFASACTALSEKARPMSRFASLTVLPGLDAAWFLAASPTSRVPSSLANATHDAVVWAPLELGIISTRPAPGRTTETAEYVVPRSMPTTTSSPSPPPAAGSGTVVGCCCCCCWIAAEAEQLGSPPCAAWPLPVPLPPPA